MTNQPEVFRRTEAILGESLVLDAPARAMLWCDITAGIVHRSPLDGDPDGSDDTVILLPAPVASFHLADLGDEPGLVVSLWDRVVLVNASGEIVDELARIDHAHLGMRLNEGKVDPFGRWVTGSMDLTRGLADGAFYAIDPDGDQQVLAAGLGTANGLEFTRDGRRIYFTDTSVKTVYTAEYGPAGLVGAPAVFHRGAAHDGLVIDADGWLWSAIYGEGVVVRYDESGVERERHEFPAPNVTSVAFAGSTLYVTSARENLTEEQLEAHPLSGSVFALETSTSGFAARVFASVPRS